MIEINALGNKNASVQINELMICTKKTAVKEEPYTDAVPTNSPSPSPVPTNSPSPSPAPTGSPTDKPEKEYPYDIDGITLQSETGETYDKPPVNSGFTVNVKIERNEERGNNDIVLIAVYDKTGKLLNMDYEAAEISDKEQPFKFNVPAQESEIGSIKAFVWDGLDSMKPLYGSRTELYN